MEQEHISNYMVAQPKKELQQIERLPSKNGKLLSVALQSNFIGRSNDSDIKTVLKFIMMKIGIRANNIPDDLEKEVLVDHIKKNYPNNTVSEIKLAFEMAINGDLDLTADQINCYENFSCVYFSKIMNAYRQWAAEEYKLLKHDPPPQRIYTDKEIDNLHRQWTEEFYQQLRNGYSGEVPQYCYGILLKDGLIQEDQSPVNFFVYKLGIQQKNIYVKS